MPASSKITILLAIDQPDSREHLSNLLQKDNLPAPPPPFDSIRVETLSPGKVEGRIKRSRKGARQSGFVLVSDGLVNEGDFQHPPTSFANDLLDQFGDSLFTTIAVMSHPDRVSDIERSISQKPNAEDFAQSLDRCIRKLVYLRKPGAAKKYDPNRYVFRVLEFDHHLLEYFRFRYDVYSVMCYLDPDAERAPSGLEIDWFDKSSLHVGVYFKETAGYEKLIGTGRLIASGPIERSLPDSVARLAAQDPVLKRSMDNAVGLRLPVLQSQGFVELVQRLYDLDVVAGDVSRVIVAPEHRGMGLSKRITNSLIHLATQAGLSDLLLECLPIHTDIYAKSGFKLVPKALGRVYKIGRTMAVMALPLGNKSIFSQCFFAEEPAK